MSDEMRQMKLQYLDHQLATGKTPDGSDAVFILVKPHGSEGEHAEAVVLGCDHVCDRLVEQLREAKASLWPHRSGPHEESDAFHDEEVTPGLRVVYRAGKAEAEAPERVEDPAVIKAVERAVARHERAARQLRLWLDAASRDGVSR
jgi:hypothetical protein